MHAKADAETIAVRPILDLPNVTLLVDAEVTSLETDAGGGSVTGVVVARNGNTETYAADIVVLAAGAANSAKILLRSANDAHPNGLANGSDQVGRNYMFHNCKAIVVLARERNDTVFQKTLAINDFYLPWDDYQWPAGNIQMIGKSNAEAMKGEEPKLTKLAPHWTLADTAAHAVDFWLTTEDLPVAGEPCHRRRRRQRPPRIPLDERRRGRPPLRRAQAVSSTTSAWPNTTSSSKNFYMDMSIPVAGSAHQAGTCRFGDDPATSVLDPNCKAHELDNLYVVDTSFFPSIGAVDPGRQGRETGTREVDWK